MNLGDTAQAAAAVEQGAEAVGLLREVMDQRMYPLTLDGLDKAMRALTR